MSDLSASTWGGGVVLRPEDFGGTEPGEASMEDRFAARQDAIHRLNVALADADAEAMSALTPAPSAAAKSPDFSEQVREVLQTRHAALSDGLSDPADREDIDSGFDGLAQRHMSRALAMDRDARVRARADGAERALEQIKAAAIVDPDGLADRLADAQHLLGRMVAAGVDANAAVARAGLFRAELGGAVLDDLADRDPVSGIARIDNGLFNGFIADGDKAPIREALVRLAEADARAVERRGVLAEQQDLFEAGARRRSAVVALTSALQSGGADDGHIARALYRGEIDEEDAADLSARLAMFDEERLRRAQDIDQFDVAVKSGLTGTASVGWSPDVVDAWWSGERARGADSLSLIPDCFGQSGCIPQAYIADLRTGMLSGLPDDAVAAGREFDGLRQRSNVAADAVLSNLMPREAGKLSALARYVELDLPAARVVELAEEGEARDRETDHRVGRRQPGIVGDVDPPTNDVVDLHNWYDKLDYRDEGPSELTNALTGIPPTKWPAVYFLRDDALQRASQAQRDNNLSIMEKDAFRHAYWSYKLSEMLGIDDAKKVGDAHERMSLQMAGSRDNNALGTNTARLRPRNEGLMDLYNNHVGRQLYQESQGKPDVDVALLILDALRSGRLQRAPFKVKK